MGAFEIRTSPGRDFGCIQFSEPVELNQIRILKIGSTIDLKDSKFKSTTQSEDIEEVLVFANSLGSKPQSSKMDLLAKINKPGNLMSKECIVPIPHPFQTDSMVIRGRFEVLSIALYGRLAKKMEYLRKPFDLSDMKRKLEEKRKRGSILIPLSELQDGPTLKSEVSKQPRDRVAPSKQSSLLEFVKENSLFDEINSNLLSVFRQLVEPGLDVLVSYERSSAMNDTLASKQVALQNTLVSELTRLYKVLTTTN